MHRESSLHLCKELYAIGGGDPRMAECVEITGPKAVLRSVYRVTDLAAATIAAATLAVAEWRGVRTGAAPRAIEVDTVHACTAFRSERYLALLERASGPSFDSIAGDYATRDGFVRLHTSYAHHRDAALSVLAVERARDAVATAVARWDGEALEAAVVAAGGCAARMRSVAEWHAHPQGAAVSKEPLIARGEVSAGPTDAPPHPDAGERPLAGVRVLDLTRVIAGPVCTRTLAAWGAAVLRIDPRGFADSEPLLLDTTAGKRCAQLDLTEPADRAKLESLVRGADVLVHGYRSDALAKLGYDLTALRKLNSGLVVTALDAYGWTGSWTTRRGFDSLVQMSCGIANRGQEAFGTPMPAPLPAQALDHGAGYLMAMATVRALTERATAGRVLDQRLSLARVAHLLQELGEADVRELGPQAASGLPRDIALAYCEESESPAGRIRRVRCPGTIDGLRPEYPLPPGMTGTHTTAW
jgi:crotonobetainyl-CoA:carnitine CoA-transferase CaiB-like acyl-CoA transferase